MYNIIARYYLFENSRCLPGIRFYQISSDGTQGHPNCVQSCNRRSNCGGFTYLSQHNLCYFKSLECGNDITKGTNVDLYIKPGTPVK